MSSQLTMRRSPKTWLLVLVAFVGLSALLWYRSDAHWLPTFGSLLKPGAGRGDQDAQHFTHADEFNARIAAFSSIKPLSLSEAARSCAWSNQDLEHGNFAWGKDKAVAYDSPWTQELWNDTILESQTAGTERFLRTSLISYASAANSMHDRGIVVVLGKEKSFEGAKVILQQLNQLGSALPVEVHHRGTDDISSSQMAELQAVYSATHFNDANSPENLQTFASRSASHFDLRRGAAAILNSRFAEVILLDTDTIPLLLPDELFRSKAYSRHGTIFWNGFARTRQNNPLWALSKTKCEKHQFEQDTGVIVLNKQKFFYHLQLALHLLDARSLQIYGIPLFGEGNAFPFAWKMLRTSYGTSALPLALAGFSAPLSSPEPSFCGVSLLQHDPDAIAPEGRPAFLRLNTIREQPVEALQWLQTSTEGIHSLIKQLPRETGLSSASAVTVEFDRHHYIPNKKIQDDLKVSRCLDLPFVSATAVRATSVLESSFSDRIFTMINTTSLQRSSLAYVLDPAIEITIDAKPVAPGTPLRILPLGDSITGGGGDGHASPMGYRLPLLTFLESSGSNVSYIGNVRYGPVENNKCCAYPGAVMSGIDSLALEVYLEQPTIVLLHAGTNDNFYNPPIDPYDQAPMRLATMIDNVLDASPRSVILVAKIVQNQDATVQGRIDKFNAAIPSIVDSRAEKGFKIMTVDMSGVQKGGIDSFDGIHPNPDGYVHMAAKWYQGMLDADAKGWISEPV